MYCFSDKLISNSGWNQIKIDEPDQLAKNLLPFTRQSIMHLNRMQLIRLVKSFGCNEGQGKYKKVRYGLMK